MGGGKETPRQKMIGMMYLVLTALLALNVSKSILDAFCAIEANTQNSYIVQLDRGDGFKASLRSGEADAKAANNQFKVKKIKTLLGIVDKVDKETATLIKQIDDAKMHIMKLSGENVDVVKNKDKETIVWKKYDPKDPLRPSRLNLYAISAKDQYDIPMHELVGAEINAPTPGGMGMKIWDAYNAYRSKVCDLIGTYELNDKKWKVKTTKINKFVDNNDLEKQVRAMLKKQKINPDDMATIVKIYSELSKQERYEEVNEVKNVHWIGKTFDHSPLVAALASLSAMQLEVLNARASAINLLRSKVTGGDFSFNKLIALANAPAVVGEGEPFEVAVVLGAYDTDNQPTVTGGNFTVTNGKGVMTAKGGKGGSSQKFQGTISIKSKNGVVKEEQWSTEVAVIGSDGKATIEMPEMRVLYENMDNLLNVAAGGLFSSVSLSGSWTRKSGKGYICKPPMGSRNKTVRFKVSAKKKDGTSKGFTSDPYTVKPSPKPELKWGGATDGGRAKVGSPVLKVEYGNNVPFDKSKGKFSVKNYIITIAGMKGELAGGGGKIKGNHLSILKKAPKGSNIAISVKYSGTGNGRVTAMYKK